MIASLLTLVVLMAPQPGVCESLKKIAVAKDFNSHGPLASIQVPGAESVMIDPQRGYIVVLGSWPLDEQGRFDPRDKASLLKRVEVLTADVAACFPDWTEADIVESESRPELVAGFSFFKGGRTIEVQVYDDLDEGFKVRIQVVAPGALAAPTKQSLCPTLNQVIAAHSTSRDFGPLKKSPVVPPGAKSGNVVELGTPVGQAYEAVFGEWNFVGERPPAAQMNEIMRSLQLLAADVAGCLPSPEWTLLKRPASPGDMGSVEFTRGNTLVSVTGKVSGSWSPNASGQFQDFKGSVKVVFIVREKPR